MSAHRRSTWPKKCRVGLLVVSMLAAGSTLTVDTNQALAAATTSVITGPPCPDVMVVAARGSGEAPQERWTDPDAYPTDTYRGAGSTNYAVYTATVRGYNGIQETWHHVLPATANSAIVGVSAANGVVYATGTDDATATGTTYALSATTGQLLWTSPVVAGYSRPIAVNMPL